MREFLISIAIVFGIILVLGLVVVWIEFGARRHVRRWAESQGLTILKLKEHRGTFRRGPFTWTASRLDLVHRLTVRDAVGAVRDVWVRTTWLGVVVARWVDEAPPTKVS